MTIAQHISLLKQRKFLIGAGVSVFCLGMSIFFGSGDLLMSAVMLLLPFLMFFVAWLIVSPQQGIYWSVIMGFLSSGLARYMDAPWGLTLDVLLFLSTLGWVFKQYRLKDWSAVRNDIMMLSLIWMLYIVLELVNPEAHSAEAWFYAMRGIGFYQLMSFVLVFTYFRKNADQDRIISLIIWLSLLGTAWGFRQLLMGVDAAEHHWLYAENHHEEHILHGKLRVFSFYSDAGQFGASQAMVALMCGILALGPFPMRKRIWFAIAALITFLGFAISGTRGALAVPAGGILIFLIASKNFKILAAGLIVIGTAFYVLKFTFAFQGVEQVQRMRTALDPTNPSLMVRLNNQKTFGRYLSSRPMGGGIGTAGFWGARFSPNTLLAKTATDSWYVKIWAETGTVGVALHLFVLGYIMGKGASVIWRLKNQQLRYKAMAMYASIGGVLLSSYGNQVFGQMPTGMIMNVLIPFVFLSPLYEKELEQTDKSIKL